MIEIASKTLEEIKTALNQAQNIMVLCHQNPDGDAIGSALGLALGLQSVGLNVRVGCIDKPGPEFSFLDEIERFEQDFNDTDIDTYFVLDCGHHKMVAFHEDKAGILSDSATTINIDHHPSNDHFGEINLVDIKASSTCEMITSLLQQLEITITPSMATALALGISTDTGSFQHQNTTPVTFQTMHFLMERGADIQKISQQFFRNYELKTLRLWGNVLSELHVTPEGAAIVGVAKEDYESIGCTRNDLNGVIDYINSMPEANYSVLLSEDDKGNVKASLRTRKEDVDVRALAEQYGGGGHVKASGFTIAGGKLEKQIRWKIVTDES